MCIRQPMNPHHPPYLSPAGDSRSLPVPNPNFFLPQHHLPHPQLPPPPPQEKLTLSLTLSSVTQLLSLSHQTLASFSSQIDIQCPPKPSCTPCPYNPDHIIPSDSLFIHSLHCRASPLPVSRSSLLQSLHYTKTLNPNHQLPERTLQCTGSNEIRLSLAGYYKEFASNFFYNDCPAVVYLNELDFQDRVFTLPQILWSECGGLADNRNELDGFTILASDVWFIWREVDGWFDFPRAYSYGLLCAALRLDLVAWRDLGRWIINGSPSYGVVLDVYMRDHLSVLFGLCLKAIKREAMGHMNDDTGCSRFECQGLVQALMWLSIQLSALYGQENAKSFVVHVFKQCVLEAANKAMAIFLKTRKEEDINTLGVCGSPVGGNKPHESLEGSVQHHVKVSGAVNEPMILLSEVVASVAALHERFLLEQNFRKFQASAPPPAYQRNAEHDHVTKRADEERSKRPSFRTIVEHDSFLKRHSSNQETSNKTKTREELLAEERDYKRRRMSYRGKKSKRTKLEVMRDVIEEYMEEIKEAVEIETEVAGTTARHSSVDHDGPENIKSSFDHDSTCVSLRDTSLRKHGQEKQQRQEHKHSRTSHDMHNGGIYSNDSGREADRSYKRSSHEREAADSNTYKRKHPEKRTTNKSRQSGHKSTEPMLCYDDDDDLRDWNKNYDVPARGRSLRNLGEKHDSEHIVRHMFDDRYDPT